VNDSKREREVREVMREPPTGYFIVVPERQEEEVITFRTLVSVVRHSWKILLVTTLLAAATAAVISFLMRSSYRAEALVAPVKENEGGAGSALRSQFGGVAALAGLELSLAAGRGEEAYATLASPGFVRDFILAQNLMPILFADQWDAPAKRWREGAKPPTMEDGVKKFTKGVRTMSEDKRTGFVTVTVEWYSPELAARWANGMIEMVNERLRSEAIRNSTQSIDYLNRELAKTSVVELRQAIYRLIETQVNNAMVANVQRQYAFRFLDEAITPETRASPKRTIMVIVGALLGLLVGLIAILLRQQVAESVKSGAAG
jgi:LPS O-antigen subunit length determinant protein (WzzB/FepE family)